MKQLSKNQILMLHQELIYQTGGAMGLRDEGLLESAINAPFQTFAGSEIYPSVLEKAAKLGYGLIKNHPFVDGNKRIGTHVMLVFLVINHLELSYEDNELIDLILKIAADELDDHQLYLWLPQHID